MLFLIQNSIVLDKKSPFHLKKANIFIKNNKIDTISYNTIEVPVGTECLDAEGCYTSIGWMDVGVHACDPGLEHREDLDTATNAAAFGGYTSIAILPNTVPVLHSKSEILYVKNKMKDNVVDVHALGAVSKDAKGVDLSEIYDMQAAGAIAFTDGIKPIQDSGLMLRALEYVRRFEGIILNHPHDKSLADGGQMHEALMSTSLGMKGIPAISEEMMLQRDIYLLKYSESKLHALNISTANAVDLVRKAKAEGLNITASVAAMNLAFDDQCLFDFDSHYKVLPPLREQNDIAALKAGLKDGTIDFITSNHLPQDIEGKNLEYTYAKFGAIGLQTAFALANIALENVLTIEQLIEKLAVQPREILNLQMPNIVEGEHANLTIFNPNLEWVLMDKDILSLSKNTPLVGKTIKGKVVAVVNNRKKIIFN